ncbi:putative metal-binding motif-containing protein [Myxococcota bacterium]|nr:putative metal-binding motif-containing protein [Myxococcota bacterium]
MEEANEDNNVSAPIFINMANPDLVINKFEATVSESAPYTVTYTVEVCNIGAVESGVYWIDLYYHRERDNPPTSGQPGDVHVGEPSLPHGPLPSDDEYPRPAQCVTHQFLRYNTPVGEYSSYLQADADDFVIDPDRVTNQKGPLPVEVPKGVMPAGCEDHDGDGFGYGRDCAQEPLCVINCEGNETCIAGCPVDESKLDCDDDDPAVHPGAEEDCTNNIDDNCNGTANDGCAGVNCVDNDGDGVPAGPDCNPSNVDCDDDDPDRKPGQADICGDNIDNDCDGYADDCCPGVDVCDEDGDGACTGTACPGPRDPECVAACDGNISCIEECPPMKDPACVAECEGKPNYNTCVAECPDFKDPACVALCEGKPNYTACVAACPPPQDGDDSNPDCGWAGSVEICGDHVDNDCDGIPDDGCPGTYCEDNDNDGFGVGEGCQGPQDCDDNNPDMNPGATENCGDGIDDNCDFVPDGMCDTCVDMDGDGYFAGNGEDCVGLPKDCDDTRAWVHPGGVEICGNNDDENCNLSITDTPCVDPADAEECLALPPEQIEACLEEHNTSGPPDNCLAADTTATGPCHDPACILACQEACATGVGCDTGLNACIDACPIWVETCVDTDGDGWGVGPGCPWEDCAPDDDTIFPNAVETCDGIDNDCDGTADDWSAAGGEQCLDHECVVGCSGDATCLGMCPTVDCVDHDGDGWGVGADCDRQDPDDNNPSTYPNAREICGDGIDQDGDNVADDDCPICKDHDGDGFGVGPGCAQLDCDDSNPDINPGVNEVCGETDTNCDGKTPAATICVESVGTCQCRAVGQRNSRAPLLPILLVMLLLGGLRLRRE